MQKNVNNTTEPQHDTELPVVMRTIPRGANHHHFWIEDNILYESYTTIRGMRYCFKKELQKGTYADTDNVSGHLEECIAKEYFTKPIDMKQYKVIADYPDSKFKVGEVLVQYFFEPPSNIDSDKMRKFIEANEVYCYTTNPENPLEGGCIGKQFVENMPHLFRQISSDIKAVQATDEALVKTQIEGKQPIFHAVMDRKKWGLSEEQAMKEDMAQEYAVIAEPSANGGLVVYAKHLDGTWAANPWSVRFLIRELLERIDIVLQPFIVEKYINQRWFIVAGEEHKEEQWERKGVFYEQEAARTTMLQYATKFEKGRYRVVDYSGKVIFTISS